MINNTAPSVRLPAAFSDPKLLKIADISWLGSITLQQDGYDGAAIASAAAAVKTFASCTGLDSENDLAATAITDLLANLMHLCNAIELPFSELLSCAGEHFENETGSSIRAVQGIKPAGLSGQEKPGADAPALPLRVLCSLPVMSGVSLLSGWRCRLFCDCCLY